MGYLIGADEAGYGPNFGPLVITVTAWRTDGEVDPEKLYELLEDCVCRMPADHDDRRLAIADSKQLYHPQGGLGLLERGVAAALLACGTASTTWRGIWQALAELDHLKLNTVPWHDGYDHELPLTCSSDDIASAVFGFREGLQKAGLELIAIRSTAIFPAEFNELVERHGNKATVLSQCTLELVRKVFEPLDDGPVLACCDKHGGRNNYHALLQTLFPEYLVEIRRESRDVSIYRWGPRERRVEVRFVVKGERILAAALASMVSKYLRELAMRAFNEFWLREIPGLRPTAGYPTDARRFKDAIAQRQQVLGIPDCVLWRSR